MVVDFKVSWINKQIKYAEEQITIWDTLVSKKIKNQTKTNEYHGPYNELGIHRPRVICK